MASLAMDESPGDDADLDLDLVRSSAREFLTDRGGKTSVAELAQMDWTGLLVDESLGGVGWRPLETAVIAEEMGRAGDGSAWFGTTLAAAALATAPDEQRERWLPGLLSGAVTAGFAGPGSTVRVIKADDCDILVVFGTNGIHLFDGAADLARMPDTDLLDGGRPVWRVQIADARGVAIGSPARAAQLAAVGRLLLSADSVGALSRTFERLVEYLRDRYAFGAPIASFQAIQHRLVELLVFEVKARAVIMKAVRAVAADRDDAQALTLAAHAFAAEKATAAVDECMQLSGGIGFTWEYPLHHDMRRVFDNSHVLGTARTSRQRLAEVSGW